MPDGLLAGYRVIEWGEHISAPYAGRLLADLGADVVKVEGPDGDTSRRHGPFPGDRPDPEQSGLYHVLNFGKRGIMLDVRSPQGLAQLGDLLDSADVLITNQELELRRELGLDGETLSETHPRLVSVAVTPFGDSGRYAELPGCSLTVSALAGASWAIGLPGRPPITLPFELADYEGGANAAAAALAALLAREWGRSGQPGGGQAVDVAIADVLASFVSINALIYVNYGKPWARDGRRASRSGGPYPYTLLPCRDGFVALIGRSRRDWGNIVRACGAPALSEDERFRDPFRIAEECADDADAVLVPWLARYTRAELLEIAREHQFALAPVRSVAEVLREPQFVERGVFVEPIDLGGATITPPRSPYLVDGGPPRQVRRAPRLGEHTAELATSMETLR